MDCYKRNNLINDQVQAKGEGLERAGVKALTLLASPLNALILKALSDGPMGLAELTQAVGVPPPTTMRMHLRAFGELGVVERRQQREFPQPVEYELGRAGIGLLGVADALEVWLQRSPQGPMSLGSGPAKSSTKALAEGWSSAIIRALASRPLALTELSRLISGLSYPSLERRLNTMRLAGLIERCASDGRRARPYEVSRWLRSSVLPLTAAARWERKHLREETSAIQRIDVEAAFLLTLPLVKAQARETGLCRLTVDTSSGSQHRQAGVLVEVEDGAVASCVTRLDSRVTASASGSVSTWMKAVRDRDLSRMEVHGDRSLVNSLIAGMNQALLA
jgi:DNA-binding HxlR family transcriptional regulator